MTALYGGPVSHSMGALSRTIAKCRAEHNVTLARMEIAQDIYASVVKAATVTVPTKDRTSTIMGIEFRTNPLLPDGFAVFMDRAGNVLRVIDTNAKPDA